MILSEEHLLLRNTVRKKMNEQSIREMVKKYERHNAPFAWDFVHEMAALGLTGINIPEEYGGQGADNLSGVIAMMEMSRVWAGGALIIGVGNSLTSYPLVKFGTAEQKKEWLPQLAEGYILGCFGLTEADHGSDAGGITTYAERVSKTCWLISGEKHFITNAPVAAFGVIFARTNRKSKDHKGISAFVMPMNRDKGWGIETLPADQKLGLHAAQMGRIFFNSAPVAHSRVLGEPEKSFSIAMATLAHGRNWITAQCIGLMDHAAELGVDYAKLRHTFGAPLFSRPAILKKLDEIRLVSDISKLLLFYSAHLEDLEKEYYPYASLAKLYASENARRLSQEVQKIFGGAGYVLESEISGVVADSLVPDIYEGASNVQRSVILRAWLENRLPVYPKPPYTYFLANLKTEAEELGGRDALQSPNQVRLFEIADIIPLVAARHLFDAVFSKEWPKEFMFFHDPLIFESALQKEIKLKWPREVNIDDNKTDDAASAHLNA